MLLDMPCGMRLVVSEHAVLLIVASVSCVMYMRCTTYRRKRIYAFLYLNVIINNNNVAPACFALRALHFVLWLVACGFVFFFVLRVLHTHTRESKNKQTQGSKSRDLSLTWI